MSPDIQKSDHSGASSAKPSVKSNVKQRRWLRDYKDTTYVDVQDFNKELESRLMEERMLAEGMTVESKANLEMDFEHKQAE